MKRRRNGHSTGRGDFVRDSISLLLSGALHFLPVVLGLLPALALRMLPKPPIEFEILPPRPKPAPSRPALLPVPPQPPPAPPPRPKSEPGASRAQQTPPPQAPSLRRFDLAKKRLSGLGSESIDQDLGVRVLLRMPLLRQSPHRNAAEALLNAFPDAHILAAGTSLAATPTAPATIARALIDDLDALFIATADPRDIGATLFYAVPRAGSELVQKLLLRRSPRWDTRSLQVLRPELLAFARPDLLPPPPDVPPSVPPENAPPPIAEEDKILATIRRPGPALYVEIMNLKQRIRLRSDLPTPVTLRLALSSDADPELHARIELETAPEAAQLLTALPNIQKEMSSRLFWLGLGGLLGGLKIEGRGLAVEVSGRLPRGDTAVLLSWIKQLLPPPDRFLDPPPPPPAAPDDLGVLHDGGADAGF